MTIQTLELVEIELVAGAFLRHGLPTLPALPALQGLPALPQLDQLFSFGLTAQGSGASFAASNSGFAGSFMGFGFAGATGMNVSALALTAPGAASLLSLIPLGL